MNTPINIIIKGNILNCGIINKDMIRQTAEGWTLFSHKGKRLGSFTKYVDAVAREKQIKMFKHMHNEGTDKS